MQNALFFLVKTIADLYLLAFLLRFIMQWTRADFFNPLAQFIVRVTNPLVVPARRMIPSARGVDVPTLAVLIALEAAATLALLALVGFAVPPGAFVIYVVLRIIHLTLWFYTIAIIVYVILSWVGQSYGPIAGILADLVEPVLRPLRSVLPPIGGLDLSPLAVLLLMQAAAIALPLPGVLR